MGVPQQELGHLAFQFYFLLAVVSVAEGMGGPERAVAIQEKAGEGEEERILRVILVTPDGI